MRSNQVDKNYFFTSEFQWRSFNNCFSRTSGKMTCILINSNVVQMFHRRLALFHAAPAAGRTVSWMDFLSDQSILSHVSGQIGTWGTMSPRPGLILPKSGTGLDAQCGQRPDKIRHRHAHPLSLTLQSEFHEFENQVLSLPHCGAVQVNEISAGEQQVRQSHRHPSSYPSGAGFAPHQLNPRPKEGMPLRGKSVPSVLL